jgi:Xaa-Pro aminopeptidase
LLFCDPKKITKELADYFDILNVKIIDLAKINDFGNICKQNKIKQVFLDPNYVSYFFYRELKKHEIKIIKMQDPIIAQKALKNSVEISGIKKAHLLDGIAKTKFLFWLEHHPKPHQLDELQIANKLLEFRKENADFIYPSFSTIAAFAENGAIIHYNPTIETNRKFDIDSLLLLDSGGQYKFGTTDVTRTIAIGTNIKPEQIRDYTLTLKGQIALATAIFPANITGSQLDVLARQYLWQDYKDYQHGTGHGVGHFLNVHEGPHNIGKSFNPTILQAGMITSNEPGIYIDGKYGIRLENIILVKEEVNNFLSFETLTLVPYDDRLIDFTLLTKREKTWLSCYNKKLNNLMSDYLEEPVKSWLNKKDTS